MKRDFQRHEQDKETGQVKAVWLNETGDEESHDVLDPSGNAWDKGQLTTDAKTGHQYVTIDGRRVVIAKNLAYEEFEKLKVIADQASEPKVRLDNAEALARTELANQAAAVKRIEAQFSRWDKLTPAGRKLVPEEEIDEERRKLDAALKEQDRLRLIHEAADIEKRKQAELIAKTKVDPGIATHALNFPKYSANPKPLEGETEEDTKIRTEVGIGGSAFDKDKPPVKVGDTTLKVDPNDWYESEITFGGADDLSWTPDLPESTTTIRYPRGNLDHTTKDRELYNKELMKQRRKGLDLEEAHKIALKKYPPTRAGWKEMGEPASPGSKFTKGQSRAMRPRAGFRGGSLVTKHKRTQAIAEGADAQGNVSAARKELL